MPKTKIIYSLRIHVQLQQLGFSYITEMRNLKNPNLNCWVYEDTPAFEEAISKIMGGISND